MEQIFSKRLIAVLIVENERHAEPMAEALISEGLDVLEVTFRTASAAAVIQRIVKAFPKACVGAGTVLDAESVLRAMDAGAAFGVAPGVNENVVSLARDKGWPFIPGVMTPSDIERALVLGCRRLKFFPAEAAGGVKMLKALAGPYAHTGVRFVPTGGINPANAPEYLKLPAVAALGGTWLATPEMLAAEDWPRIRATAKEAAALAKKT